jgi:hypothetical protein
MYCLSLHWVAAGHPLLAGSKRLHRAEQQPILRCERTPMQVQHRVGCCWVATQAVRKVAAVCQRHKGGCLHYGDWLDWKLQQCRHAHCHHGNLQGSDRPGCPEMPHHRRCAAKLISNWKRTSKGTCSVSMCHLNGDESGKPTGGWCLAKLFHLHSCSRLWRHSCSYMQG